MPRAGSSHGCPPNSPYRHPWWQSRRVQESEHDAGAATRRLVIMRHSKAEQGGRTDFERELAPSGVRESADSGAWLAEQGVAVDGVLVSAAVRARQTWEALAAAAGYDVVPEPSPALYTADVDSALDLVRRTADDVRSLLVVGHNPTMAYLATDLDDGASDYSNDLVLGFPTAALAVFDYDGTWADLSAGACRLVALSSPAARG